MAPTSFGLDEMHMLGLGISKQLISLIDGGKRNKKDYTHGDLYLGERTTNALFIEMENSLPTIPTVFDGSFRPPISTYTTRAVDWLDIIRYIIPSLFIPAYETTIAKDALLALVTIIQIALQSNINDELLRLMEE